GGPGGVFLSADPGQTTSPDGWRATVVVTQNPGMWADSRFEPALDRARDLLTQSGDVNEVIGSAHAEGMPFIQCVRLLTNLGISLADAKPLVHNSPAYAGTRQDREEFCEALDEAAQRPGLSDSVILMRCWADSDAAWYPECVR